MSYIFGNKEAALIFNLRFPTLGEGDFVEKVAKKDAKKIKESRMCGTYEAPCKWNSYSRTKISSILLGCDSVISLPGTLGIFQNFPFTTEKIHQEFLP